MPTLGFDADLGPFWPYLFILIAGFLATEIWRWAGVLVGHGLSEDSLALKWVRAVATALVAGVIAQLVLQPSGVLSAAPMALRIGAAGAGFLTYLLARRNLVAGIAVAEVVLIGGWYLTAHA